MLDWTERVVVVGEVAQAHDGSLGLAHAHAIAQTDADAVNFQTHIAAAESTPRAADAPLAHAEPTTRPAHRHRAAPPSRSRGPSPPAPQSSIRPQVAVS